MHKRSINSCSSLRMSSLITSRKHCKSDDSLNSPRKRICTGADTATAMTSVITVPHSYLSIQSTRYAPAFNPPCSTIQSYLTPSKVSFEGVTGIQFHYPSQLHPQFNPSFPLWPPSKETFEGVTGIQFHYPSWLHPQFNPPFPLWPLWKSLLKGHWHSILSTLSTSTIYIYLFLIRKLSEYIPVTSLSPLHSLALSGDSLCHHYKLLYNLVIYPIQFCKSINRAPSSHPFSPGPAGVFFL